MIMYFTTQLKKEGILFLRTELRAIICSLIITFSLVVLSDNPAYCAQAVADTEVVSTILPTSENIPREWNYTFQPPSGEWKNTDFDDSTWSKGNAPFGDKGATIWKTTHIWLRKRINLPQQDLPQNPHAVYLHDEDITVFINGELVLHRPGYTSGYVKARLRNDVFTTGTNLVAIHCMQTIGGQAVDFGIIDVEPELRAKRDATIRIKFDVKASPDLDKEKFNVYNCPYFKMERWFRDIHLLEELGCSSLRYDPTWGGHNVGIDFNSPQISGTPHNLVYTFLDFDRFTDSLLKRNIEPMYVMAYTPEPLQREKGIWSEKPTDMNAWQRICRDYAAHWRTTNRKVPYYEIWNEPDNQPFFFRGSLEDYCEIYRRGAEGIREGNPDALVGGPAVAALKDDDSWLYGFLDFVSSNSVPLDFLSFHNYGNPEPIIRKARTCLSKYPALAHLPMMLTEYNSFVPLTPAFVEGGNIELYSAASRLLHDFKTLLNYPDVTKVYWAMFNDPDTHERCGLVSLDGHRKAAFNAFKIYMDMPTTGRKAESSTTEVEVLASCDTRHAAAVIWNCSQSDYNTTVDLGGIPANLRSMSVYRIDRTHGSYYDDPRSETLEPVEEYSLKGNSTDWNGIIPSGGVVYIKIKTIGVRPR